MDDVAWIRDLVPAGAELAIEPLAAADLESRAAAAGVRALGGRVVARRQREYLAGRLAAHAALRALGATCTVVGRHGQAPRWPEGWCGSISHGNSLAAAIVAPALRWRALGIDLQERLEGRRIGVAEAAMSPQEQAAARSSADPWTWTRVWAAKEAAWKCLSALGSEPPLETLVPQWANGERADMVVATPGGPVRVALASRIGGDTLWMLARVAHGD